MSTDARIRINEHRLVRAQDAPAHEVRIEARRDILDTHKRARRRAIHTRSVMHVAVFALAFIFTTGTAVLGVLLWVRPDSFASLVFVGVFSSAVFVVSFAVLRLVSLVHLFPDTHARETGEEEHHLAKSIAYGFVALVFAVLLAGLLINVATAFTV